jgi:hypothetical protein
MLPSASQCDATRGHMSIFDRILIDPGPADRDQALAEAVVAANARFLTKLIARPPAGLDDFLRDLDSKPEGIRGWHGGTRPNYWEGRSQVTALWWTDHLGRKHVRVLGGSGGEICLELGFTRDGKSYKPRSPLEHLYPEHCAWASCGGRTQLLVLCDCGAIGTPQALGWMGRSCGPCHDRLAEGAAPPTPLAFSPGGLAVVGLSFAPDGSTLALASPQSGISLRDLRTGAAETLVEEDGENVFYTPNGGILGILDDAAVILWDRRRREVGRWPIPIVGDVVVAPDGLSVALSPFRKGVVELRSATDGAIRWKQEVGEEGVSGLAFSPSGELLAGGCYAGPLRLWSVSSGRLVRELADDIHPTSLAFSPDGKVLAGVSTLKKAGVLLWEADTGKPLPACALPGGSSASTIAFAPTGRVLVAGDGGMLHIWDLEAGGERLDLQWGGGNVLSLAFAPDGSWLAAGTNSDGLVRLWPWAALLGLLRSANG